MKYNCAFTVIYSVGICLDSWNWILVDVLGCVIVYANGCLLPLGFRQSTKVKGVLQAFPS